MNDRVVHSFTASRLAEMQAEPNETEIADDLGAFGWLRGVKERSVMLELRKKDGSVLAVDYGGLEIEFDPSVGITLLAMSGRKIRITGLNLNAEIRPHVRLFDGLTRHRVPWIQEADQAASFQAGRDATVIETIVW